MVPAALLIASLMPPPPVARTWKKGARATYRVVETTGNEDAKVEIGYFVQVRILSPGQAEGKIQGRTVRLNGKVQPGILGRSAFTFAYGPIGPVTGSFEPGIGGGNALIWAMSSPGWRGVGFEGATERDGWHGTGRLVDASATSEVRLETHLRKDGWPQKVHLDLATPVGGYSAEIQRL